MSTLINDRTIQSIRVKIDTTHNIKNNSLNGPNIPLGPNSNSLSVQVSVKVQDNSTGWIQLTCERVELLKHLERFPCASYGSAVNYMTSVSMVYYIGP